ncbi:hypothetical protein L288_05390 [Sphingobium quisquiliarum P25]|uniref:Uncharacterized protein n=1 Tax=Sphingobium quisquiliarum P25 TaxID=1329909 RepID=T0IDW8_9SPHN|nr:hypothetical protein L288_05390 [Sphingobium quisquiliarum P25]
MVSGNFLPPFALSLSKGFTSLQERRGPFYQAQDRLSPNGGVFFKKSFFRIALTLIAVHLCCTAKDKVVLHSHS